MEKPWMVYPIGILMFPLFSMWCHICYTHYMVSLYMMLIQWYPPWIYIYIHTYTIFQWYSTLFLYYPSIPFPSSDISYHCIFPTFPYPQHPEVTTTNFVDRSVNAKSCDGGSDGFVHRALANGMWPDERNWTKWGGISPGKTSILHPLKTSIWPTKNWGTTKKSGFRSRDHWDAKLGPCPLGLSKHERFSQWWGIVAVFLWRICGFAQQKCGIWHLTHWRREFTNRMWTLYVLMKR